MHLCPCRVKQLSVELLQKRRQEEEEARRLESMVQSVEHNLRLMTVCEGGPARRRCRR